MIIFLLLFFFLHDINTAGFAENTLLLTNCDHVTFNEVDYDTRIQADENYFQPILFIGKQSVEKIIQITVTDEIITCHSKQLFWCVNKDDWICAQDLISGDLLETVDEQQIIIDVVQIVQQQTELYSLTVGPPHYLYVGKHAVLAHNVVPYILVVAAPLTSTIAVKVAATAFGTGLVAFGAWVANLFAKNRNNKKPKLSVAEKSVGRGPVFFNPNDDDKNDKNKHPNGIYEDADYHGLSQNGHKSPRPKNGQEALDNSYEFGGESTGRIAIQDGEFVVLRQHNPGRYHGYRSTWKDLPQKAKNVLQDLGFANCKGKIL